MRNLLFSPAHRTGSPRSPSRNLYYYGTITAPPGETDNGSDIKWTKDNIALIGDAAHATTPNLGQGAAQAIEDAFVLASELKEQGSDIPLALRCYQERRIVKAHHIVNTSRKFGQMTNMRNPVGIRLRNWIIRTTPGFITNRQIEKVYKVNF